MRNEAGYTILEALVATTILAMILSLAYERIGIGMSLHHEDVFEQHATTEADKIIKALGNTIPLTDGVTEGSLSQGLRWRLSISSLYQRAPNAQLPKLEGHNIDLMFSWPQHGTIRSIEFRTICLGIAQ